MIHYHGTPITPREKMLAELQGRCFCVRYGEHRDDAICHEIGQSVLLDNGAFSFWTKNKPTDWPGFVAWAKPWLEHRTTWAVMPDVIDGDEEANELLSAWLFNYDREVWSRCAPVWHLHEGLDRLKHLCASHDRVCLGSSGQFSDPASDRWRRRMDQAMNAVCGNGPAPTWLHMLRAMDQAVGGHYPFASADSTNLARNHAGSAGRPPQSLRAMADRIDSRQTPARWHMVPELVSMDEAA